MGAGLLTAAWPPQKQRKSPPRARNARFTVANNTLDQSVRSQNWGLQNNEIGSGYQPNLHTQQGNENNGPVPISEAPMPYADGRIGMIAPSLRAREKAIKHYEEAP